MFSKRCSKCNNNVKKDFKYCPICGNNVSGKHDKEDYGFLGRNDLEEQENSFGFGENIIDKIFNKTMKMLEKQIGNISNDIKNNQYSKKLNHPSENLNVQFFVNGKKVPLNQPIRQNIKPEKIIQRTTTNPQKLKQFAKLPKQEAEGIIKRLSGKIIYEISVPGVSNIEDILINQLESSIEIKALSKTKVYTKTINLKLPIISYTLDKDNLILEFQGK